eukprot:CAMPEP_0179976748 /NCGR_PEP_ID=MMETSP0983-20121128/39565_1 /TAXON_ID=483367 /ORGANISM="non described non described, Strain CCMP 2436" /LENGTH=48 /DNA_ID= /DNA_START= /DNA_END= /DNA_ORIENTATION=
MSSKSSCCATASHALTSAFTHASTSDDLPMLACVASSDLLPWPNASSR